MSTISEQAETRLSQIDTEAGEEFTNMLKTLESVFQSPKHWVLEFLQNAEDARAKKVLIQLSEDSLWVLNDGQPFNSEDFVSLCSVNSRKLPALGFKGFIGIGFKSIFHVTDEVEIHSGAYHFKFAKPAWYPFCQERNIPISKVPWEVLPVEIPPQPLVGNYTTGFFIPFADAKAQEVRQEIEDFLSSPDFPKEAILLLDHISVIGIVTPGDSSTISKRVLESESLLIGERILSQVTREGASFARLDETSYQIFRKVISVPTEVKADSETERVRRSDVSDREIGLIFGAGPDNGVQTLQGKLTGVYSFLPIEGEQTGLPFGIFGDFIPQPGRDMINYGAVWNQWMCGEVETFFEQVVREIFLNIEGWATFPLQLLQQFPYALPTGPGGEFWNRNLREKVETFLETEPLHPDDRGIPRSLKDLMNVEANVLDVVGKEFLEDLIGKKLAHPSIREWVGGTVRVDDLLQNTELMESLSRRPDALVLLYNLIEQVSDYYINGGQGRYTPLYRVPFVLAEDGRLYPPNDVFVPQTDLASVPNFLKAFVSENKHVLHSAVASDLDAVNQLARCRVEIIDIARVVSTLAEIVGRITEPAGCPSEWKYPEDLIRATLFVAAQNGPPVSRLVADDDTVLTSELCFVPGADLDWQPLWQANLLPGFSPVNSIYTSASTAQEIGLEIQQVRDYLFACRAHGFDSNRDGGLTETAAYAIATQRLQARGHVLAPVTQRDNLGYDFECSGHCNLVFEIKGQSEPRDENLPESETNAAKQKGEDYVLVFVFNLPSQVDNIRYKEVPNPQTIFVAIDRTRVPKDSWLAYR